MHPSKQVRHSRWPAAARVAVAIAGGALLCTAATGPALASARHSQSHNSQSHSSQSHSSHSHTSRSHTSRSHKPAAHKPAAHKPAKPSAPSSASGGWASYTVLTAGGSKAPRYELAVRRDGNGDLSLNVVKLGGAGSAPTGSGGIRPGSILVLPANGSTPTGTAVPRSAQPTLSGGWADSYTVPPAQAGESQVLDELMVRRAGNGDLSLDVFQLGGGSSAESGEVIKPGWILLLPANGSAPAAPTGPLAQALQAGATPITSQGTDAGAAQHSATQHSATQHSATQHSAAQQKLTGAVAPTSARLVRTGEIGAAVLIAVLLAVGLAIRRRRGSQGAGKPDRRGPAAGQRSAMAAAPAPAVLMPVPVPVLAGGTAPALSGGSAAAGGGMMPSGAAAPPRPAVVESAAAGAARLDDASWPDYLVPAGPGPGPVAAVATSAVRSPEISHGDGYPAAAHSPDSAQRHRVIAGDDEIEVMLAQAPAAGRGGGSGWLASSPYLAWTPLPYDIPQDGVAFACLGTGDKGCLFIDLAAAPGVISIGGDRAAGARLAESIAHQVSMAGHDGRVAVTVVGDAVPGPLPAGVTEVATVAALGPGGPGDATAIVFCAPRSDGERFALARYTAAAQHRVIPVVLADVPDAPWSFTAQPSPRPS